MKHPVNTLILLVGLVLCGNLAADPRHHDDELRVLAHLRQYGIQDGEAERIIGIFAQSVEENIDTSLLHKRLREGLAKKVSPDVLANALQTRLDALRTAHRLLSADDPAENDENKLYSERAIIHSLAQALESGVPETALMGLRMRQHDELGLRQRTQAIIEAAEVLHLAGIGPGDIRRFIELSIERQAGRGMIVRAAANWIELHRQGLDSDAIFRQIWIHERRQQGYRRQPRRQHRTER